MLKPRVPLINWAHPLTKGLVFDCPLFEGGGTAPVDVSMNTKGAFAGSTQPNWIVNITSGLNFNSSTPTGPAVYATPNAKARALSLFSLETLILVRSNGANNAGTIFRTSDGTTTAYALRMDTTKNSLRLQITTNGTSGNFDMTNATPLNVVHHVVVSYDGTNIANVPVMYLDGVAVSVTTTTVPTGTLNTTADSQFILGNINQTGNVGTRTWDGHIYLMRIRNRLLSAQEVKQLYTDPWQIYIRPSS